MEEQHLDFLDLDATALKKLDGGIRRLLFEKDESINAAINEDKDRLEESIRRIEEIGQLIPVKATIEDRQHFAKLKTMCYAEIGPNALYGPVLPSKRKLEPVKIRAIIRFAGNVDDLVSMGIQVGMQAQDIYTVTGTSAQLAHLASQAATLKICLPRALPFTVEHACKQAEIDQVQKPRPNTPNGFNGEGVIVGIVDSALDVTHNAFREPAGTHDSRVLYYWIQTPDDTKAPGQTPEQFDPIFKYLNRGRLYTKTDINKALALGSNSVYGNGKDQISKKPGTGEHGTHVAGIAAGNGYEAGWKKGVHIGAAPKADIIHVCRSFNPANPSTYLWEDAFEDSVLEAVKFIFLAADKEKKPVVVNLSNGCQMGPHNGNTLFDQALDNFVNSYKERSIVVSAGNDNISGVFIKGEVPKSGEKALEFKFNPYSQFSSAVLDIWYTGPKLEFKCKHGNDETPWCQDEYNHNTAGFIDLHQLDVTTDTDAGLRNIRIQIVVPTKSKYWDKILEPWTISLKNTDNKNNSFFYAWVGVQGDSGSLTGAVPNELTLSDTACGKSILTVGACEKYLPPSPTAGEKITPYSGAGPTLDGRTKPEIVAVGGTTNLTVISCASDLASGYHGLWGTSQAAPLVTGAMATLFEEYFVRQKKGKLDNDDIKALLVQTTHNKGLHLDPMSQGYLAQERNQYGYGRLRMLASIDHSPPLTDVDVWIRTAVDDFGDEPFLGDVYWQSPDIHVRKPQTQTDLNLVKWGETYDVMIIMRNLGTSDAVGCELSLKCTLPFTAYSDWTFAKDTLGQDTKSIKKFTIPALNHFIITFEWKPLKADFDNPATNETHYCLLAEIDQPLDKLDQNIVAGKGVDPWVRNIKGHNNIALRNIIICD
jgi:subtilisin family serine protease